MTKNKLVITRGLPASGKSTFAREWVAEDPANRVRVNRDDLRYMLYGVYWGPPIDEMVVTRAQFAQVDALLEAGKSVIIDDTNLRVKFARKWADLAVIRGAAFEVIEIDTPVDVCVFRDLNRGSQGERAVGEGVIREMAAKFRGRPEIKPSAGPESLSPARKYVRDQSLPSAVISDLDGTLALNTSRSPYDTSRYHTDEPFTEVVRLVQDLHIAGETVIFLSGRDETFMAESRDWLVKHVGDWCADAPMFMRKAGDRRNDAIIKPELFYEHVAPNWGVRFVLDDRDRVVAAWRAMELLTLQVNYGNF